MDNDYAIFHSSMFSHYSLWNNHFTDDGQRALQAAVEERNLNPDFAKLDVTFIRKCIC